MIKCDVFIINPHEFRATPDERHIILGKDPSSNLLYIAIPQRSKKLDVIALSYAERDSNRKDKERTPSDVKRSFTHTDK